nr:serpin family protein [Tissierella sp.]
MFKDKYNDANKDIIVSEALKKETIDKMKTTNGKKQSFKSSTRVSIAALALALIIASFFLNKQNLEALAIALPDLPSKTIFEDYEKEYETIDEKFIENLNQFSIKSSSIVLSNLDKKSNSIYSPISLYMALAMVGETSQGETQAQIVEALNMDNIEMIRSETGKLFRSLYFHNKIGKLSLNNSLWLNDNIDFNKATLDRLAADYYAQSFSLDFKDKSASQKISNWVGENTGENLGNKADDFRLDKDTVMKLINTVNFYDEWIDSFDENHTVKDKFTLEDGQQIQTDFMNMTYGSHGFVGAKGYTSSALQMKNNNSMIFILPDEGVSPEDILSDPGILEDAISSLYSEKSQMGEVVFKIPKFNFQSTLDLKDLANQLGIETAFMDTGDFSPLSDTRPLFISDIKQSSTISIDEKGIQASSFTSIDYAGSAQPDGRAEMILDRPFIFLITGLDKSPLFIGVINNPTI